MDENNVLESIIKRLEVIENKLVKLDKIAETKQLHPGRYYDMYKVIDECDHTGIFTIEMIEDAKEAYKNFSPYIMLLDEPSAVLLHDKIWYLRDVIYKDYYNEFESAFKAYIKTMKKIYEKVSVK